MDAIAVASPIVLAEIIMEHALKESATLGNHFDKFIEK